MAVTCGCEALHDLNSPGSLRLFFFTSIGTGFNCEVLLVARKLQIHNQVAKFKNANNCRAQRGL